MGSSRNFRRTDKWCFFTFFVPEHCDRSDSTIFRCTRYIPHLENTITFILEIKNPVLLLIVAAVGLAFNLVGLLIFSGHAGGGHSHSHGHGHGHGHSEKVMDLPKIEDDEEMKIEEVKVKVCSFFMKNRN